MVSFGWSVMPVGSNNNIHSLDNNDERTRPLGTTQIACRICDQVFSSNQALISHIEIHDETAAARRQNDINLRFSQRDPLPRHLHHQYHQQFAKHPNFQPPNFTQQPTQSGYKNTSQPLPDIHVPHVAASPRSLLGPHPNSPVQLSPLTRRQFDFAPQRYRNEFGPQAHMPWFQFQPQSQRRSALEERSSSDYTLPFVDRLQKKIPDVKRDDGHDSEELDLTLKL